MDFHGIHLPDRDEIKTPGKKLSAGEHANVYEWGKEYVIKLFSSAYSIDDINREYYNALAVKNLPFRKAEVVELKKTEFGFGIVFKKIEGENLLSYIERTGDYEFAAEQMCILQKSIGACKMKTENVSSIESVRQQLRREMLSTSKADTDATKEMIRFLGTMKDGDSLCHGNLHPDNIMITDDGPVAVGFSHYSIGDAIYDTAKCFFNIAYTPLPGEQSKGCSCNVPGCRGIADSEERKKLARLYLNGMGTSAVEIGCYLSMVIAGFER